MSLTKEEQQQLDKINKIARHILKLSADSIVVNMRFLDLAISALKPEAKPGLSGVYSDGSKVYYDPVWLLKNYEREPNFAVRMYLHILFHHIFYHSFQYDKLRKDLWDLAVDFAVENTIIELKMHGTRLERDDKMREIILSLKDRLNGVDEMDAYAKMVQWNQGGRQTEKKKKVPFTAEHLYRYFSEHPPSVKEQREYAEVSFVDFHQYWSATEEMVIGQEQFKRISERVKAELKSFTKSKVRSESLESNLAEATKERYDYSEILSRFVTMSEDVVVNDEEFDYVYYTYGLRTYGNMPLVEPLEYKDNKKVREFVIVLDTSASCKGELIRGFLKKTYNILKQSENFFQKINIHILQCDNTVQVDTKITCDEDFEDFLKKGKIKGFGSTDFRPAFAYVDNKCLEGEFENLKGLIYFTDGYGIYPERMPGYDTIFAFLNEDTERPPLPVWAIQVILEEEGITA